MVAGADVGTGAVADAVLPRVWSLRTRMSFMVDNLQTFLKIDVLEAQYKLMLDTVKTIQDFDSLRRVRQKKKSRSATVPP